ncbi:LPP20 family lipoprotein [Roseovarius aquimarinus]|uniref:LPP20 family lipoprotein n=1 Tax=Roseovarius aquimarinus TaxID=1229156 RepID=A0ABW7I5G1_9RHOB
MSLKSVYPKIMPLALVALAACTQGPRSAVDALPEDASARTTALAETRDALTAPAVPAAAPAPVQFIGTGMSQVRTQPGASINEKRLMAIRAARMEALRDLTEQIHGISLDAQTTLRDEVLVSDAVRGIVAGEIRGARTLAITPKGEDGYSVTMALDPDTVAYILRAARQRR